MKGLGWARCRKLVSPTGCRAANPGELVRVLLAHGFATRFDLSAESWATAHLVPKSGSS